MKRRQFLKNSSGTGLAVLAPSLMLPHGSLAEGGLSNRILVVLELSGGNDGLNTLIPYGDDAYYRHRPTIGIRPEKVRKIDDHFGFSEGMVGFERLYKDGNLAIVHGCGYENPSFSHFTSMAYWHTAAPNSGNDHGWIGRLADAMRPDGASNFIVNIDSTQSLAVKSQHHTPVVFDDPTRFSNNGFNETQTLLSHVPASSEPRNAAHEYLLGVKRSARDASMLVREAWAGYNSSIDYGLNHLDLPKIAALIDSGLPTRLYYTSYRNNAFDTHVHQNNLHRRLLTYTSDAVAAFMQDLERIGRADDVLLLVFSEFGRRVPENTSLGTDHGTANNAFLVGTGVNGGHYGKPPSLVDLTDGENMQFTTDFRRVYASVIEGWLHVDKPEAVLGERFEPFDMFS